MLIAICYALVLTFLVYKYGAALLFNDPTLSKKFISLLFLLKIAAIPVFYLVYQKLYGGIELFDTGKYFADAKIIAHSDFSFFIRTMFGLQDDSTAGTDFERYLKYTQNWDNGTVKDYLYNDNRIVIRVHAIFELLAQGSYFAHALFNCCLSFIGIAFLYRAFKSEWQAKHQLTLVVLVLFPALWFYTGAVLKESLVVLTMGLVANSIKSLFSEGVKFKYIALLILPLVLCLLLKPYVLVPFFLSCLLYLVLKRSHSTKTKSALFFSALIFVFCAAQGLSYLLKGRSLQQAAKEHRIRFEALNRGGIFLSDGPLYLQLPADTSLIHIIDVQKKLVQIRPGTHFMYWLPNQANDTLYARADSSNTKLYTLLYSIKPAGSAITLNTHNGFALLISAGYYSLFYPLFVNAQGALQYLASLENLLIIISLGCLALTWFRTTQNRLYIVLFCGLAIALCIFIGYTAPNSGAILRYRAPIIVFIPISALMRLPSLKRN